MAQYWRLWVYENIDGRITVGPFVEIFLVTHFALLEPVVKPRQKSITRAWQSSQTLIALIFKAESLQLNAEAAIEILTQQTQRKSIIVNGDRSEVDFVEERL